jgi:putative peptide zinc metalloprotease protein
VAVRVFTSPEWGLLALLGVLLCGVGMLAGLDDIRQDWARDWGSGNVPWVTVCLLPMAWLFDELGRCLMWSRWRDGVPRWQLVWFGLCPMWVIDPAEVQRLRHRSWRVAVQLWGLMHACCLTCLAWLLSRTLSDPGLQWIARSWMYASLIVLAGIHLNPFMRGAAQALLQEWWRLPDLSGASVAWWRQRALLMGAWLAGVPKAAVFTRVLGAHLRWRVIGFAPVAWCVHWLLSGWLVQQLGVRHPHLALLVVACAVHALVLLPLGAAIHAVWLHPAFAGRRAWLVGVLLAMLAVVGWGALAVPWSRHLTAPGVVGMPEAFSVVAPFDGVIRSELALPGHSVYQGQTLWSLEPATLSSVDRDADAMLDAPGNWGQVSLRSAGVGQLVWLLAGDPVGRVVRRGQVLAKVVPQTPLVLRWVVPAAWAAELLEVQGVKVRLFEDPEHVMGLPLRDMSQVPMSKLPARALGTRMGGPVAVLDTDPEGLVPAEPMILMEAHLSDALPRVGGRAWVRMALPPMPLGQQAWSRLRAMWLAGL